MLNTLGVADIPRPGTHGVTKYWVESRAHVTNFSPYAYNDRITALTPDRAGGVWFGLGTTLEHIDGNGQMSNVVVSAEPLWAVSGLQYDPAGKLWFSLAQSGRIGTIDDRGNVHTQVVVARRKFPNIRTIAFDRDGSLWFEDNGRRSIGVRTSWGVTRERPLPNGAAPLALTFCGGHAWTISSDPHGTTMLYRIDGRLDRFRAIRRLANGWASLACGAKGYLWYASSEYQGALHLGMIDTDGTVHESAVMLSGASIYSGSGGSVWVLGWSGDWSTPSGRLVIARVDGRLHLLSPRTIPARLRDIDQSFTATDDQTLWLGLVFPHSVLRLRLDK